VRVSSIVFWDILILIDKPITDAAMLKKLQGWHARSLQMLAKDKDTQKVSILKPYINRVQSVDNTNEQQAQMATQIKQKVTEAVKQAGKPPKSNQHKGGRSGSMSSSKQGDSDNTGKTPDGELRAVWQNSLRFDQSPKAPSRQPSIKNKKEASLKRSATE
jgi:hypothetical protein